VRYYSWHDDHLIRVTSSQQQWDVTYRFFLILKWLFIYKIVFISSLLHFEVNVDSFYLITTTVICHCSQFYLITPTVISHCSQFVYHHNYSYKSLFTVFISPYLQFEVTVHSFYFITTIVWNHYSQFFRIATTILRHCSQFLSHHNYSFKLLFTVFITSQLQL